MVEVDDITERLRSAGVSQPNYEAQRIIAWTAPRSQDGRTRTRIDEVIRRRTEGELLAHILGEVVFMGRKFGCGPGSFPPRPPSRLVVECAVEHAPENAGLRVVDMCCGVGALGISVCLSVGEASLVGFDVSAAALGFARANALEHGIRAHFIQADISDAGHVPRQEADIVVANPPYFEAGDAVDDDARRCPPEAVFAADGAGQMVRIAIRNGAAALRPGGVLIVEHHARMEEMVAELDMGDVSMFKQTRSSAGYMSVSCFRR